jgi:monoterpene epsilon-lactone hydrolase
MAPMFGRRSGLPPLCIHVGDEEILLSDSIRLAERARAAGVDVELEIWSGMWHVFQLNARFVPEARQSIEEIGRFISVVLDDSGPVNLSLDERS